MKIKCNDCGKEFSHKTKGSCLQALSMHRQRVHTKVTVPPGTGGKPPKRKYVRAAVMANEAHALFAPENGTDRPQAETEIDMRGKWKRKPKQTVEVTVNFCPNCGTNLHSVAVGMAMTRGQS